jgi:CRP/FNR family cyclic AMP-dependent transcriptional regulator
VSNTKIEHLRRVRLFAHCSERELGFLATEADEVAVPAGTKLITQGASNDTFYMLLDGEADVEVNGTHRRALEAGDFFGEISMLDGGPASATVTVKTPVRLMVMSRSQFRDAIKSNDHLLSQVLMAVAQRLRGLAAADDSRMASLA